MALALQHIVTIPRGESGVEEMGLLVVSKCGDDRKKGCSEVGEKGRTNDVRVMGFKTDLGGPVVRVLTYGKNRKRILSTQQKELHNSHDH